MTEPLKYVGGADDRDDFRMRPAKPGEQHNIEAHFKDEKELRRHLRDPGAWVKHTHGGPVEHLHPSSFAEADKEGFSSKEHSFQPADTYTIRKK